ncbi:MAG TPA: 50S ribosomal protein L11 methyltransferase [Candidatus Eremiobacteraceae bacterium]|nr:50S ribosomal protein L11 methyltransferase [Candidatus Eremiobacteraceae bacterium]
MVPPADIVFAAALLEMATGALPAIEAGPKCGTDGRVSPIARITVHVPRADARTATARVEKMLTAAHKRRILRQVALEREDVREQAWASSWKKHNKPFRIATGLYVVPSWERAFKAPRGSKILRLDPGMAFGTGQHATTQLAMILLLPRVKRDLTVLDIGCGSGILALAAAQRGARVYASDVDAVAVHTTRDNFAANKLSAASVLRRRGVPPSFPRAHLISANITARTLEPMAAALARKLKPGGLLITSGIDRRGAASVLKALARHGLELVETGRRAQLSFEGGRPVVTSLWRAYVHRKRTHS